MVHHNYVLHESHFFLTAHSDDVESATDLVTLANSGPSSPDSASPVVTHASS